MKVNLTAGEIVQWATTLAIMILLVLNGIYWMNETSEADKRIESLMLLLDSFKIVGPTRISLYAPPRDTLINGDTIAYYEWMAVLDVERGNTVCLDLGHKQSRERSLFRTYFDIRYFMDGLERQLAETQAKSDSQKVKEAVSRWMEGVWVRR